MHSPCKVGVHRGRTKRPAPLPLPTLMRTQWVPDTAGMQQEYGVVPGSESDAFDARRHHGTAEVFRQYDATAVSLAGHRASAIVTSSEGRERQPRPLPRPLAANTWVADARWAAAQASLAGGDGSTLLALEEVLERHPLQQVERDADALAEASWLLEEWRPPEELVRSEVHNRLDRMRRQARAWRVEFQEG